MEKEFYKATSSAPYPTSSDGLPTREPGVTASPWQPSWLHWLISALSGTVEIEKQTAWMKQSNAEARLRHEEWLRNEQRLGDERRLRHEERLRKEQQLEEERQIRHEEWLRNEQRKTEELRQENARLAELESKLDAVLHRSDSSSTPMKPTDKD